MLSWFMMACNTPNNPEQKTIDTNPELVAACSHIEGGGASVTGGDGGTVYRVSRMDDALDPNTGRPAGILLSSHPSTWPAGGRRECR